MTRSTRPAVLLTELLAGEGPHQDLADGFLAAECIRCGGNVGRLGRVADDHWWCPTCWARKSAETRADLRPTRR